jgi:hypothetical protein
MKRAWLVLPLLCLAAGIAYSDSSNLEGGVFIAHHPPGLQYSEGENWCARYFQDFAIDSCSEQSNRIDTQGDHSVWFVLAAWSEPKEWRGVEFGLAAYDSTICALTSWGPCFPGSSGLEIPTAGWPGPNDGTTLTATGAPWSGNFLPVYYFVSYAYYAGEIPLGVHPVTGFGGTANCDSLPQTWAAAAFGSMGILEDGVSACPEGLNTGDGFGGGAQPDGAGGYEEDDSGAGDTPPVAGNCADGELIIRFAPGVISFPEDDLNEPTSFSASLGDADLSLPALQSALAEVGAVSFATVAPNWRHLTPQRSRDIHGEPVKLIDFADVYRVGLSGAVSVNDAIARLQDEPGIIYAECDRITDFFTLPPNFPDDPLYGQQWHLENSGDGDCEEGVDLNAYEAWELCYVPQTPYSPHTKIGISDTAVNRTHPDLAPFICCTLSHSFPDSLQRPWWTPNAEGIHGTWVASLAGAGTHNNETGVASIPNLPPSFGDSMLVILRTEMPPAPPFPPYEGLALAGCEALDYVCGPVVDGSISIVNMSWGYYEWRNCYVYNRTLRDHCRNAFRKGISLVCAAGNERMPDAQHGCSNPDTAVAFPAAFPDYSVAVAAIDCAGHLYPYTPAYKVGSYIDLAGPGYGEVTADSGNTYQSQGWGTSGASPVVAGSIALLLGADPSLTNEDCSALLKLTARPIGDLAPWQVGAGLPQLDHALTWALPPCGVVHDSLLTSVYDADSLGQWSVSFMNADGVNTSAETWQAFEVVPYRITAHVQLPSNTHVLQVWPRGSRCDGWRLIDDHLDGNTDPHYDALFYENWARVVAWGGTSDCVFECYTYKVLGDTIRWVPFQVGDECRISYSYVACDSLPGDVSDEREDRGCLLRVLGSPIMTGGSARLRATLPRSGRLWLAVYGADGRLVRELARAQSTNAGSERIEWDLRDQEARTVPAGMYFVRMKAVLGKENVPVRATRVLVVR